MSKPQLRQDFIRSTAVEPTIITPISFLFVGCILTELRATLDSALTPALYLQILGRTNIHTYNFYTFTPVCDAW